MQGGSSYHRAFAGGPNETHAPVETASLPMSVVQHAHHIAFAAYNEVTNQIILEECVVSGHDTHEIAERVIATVRPTLLLLSNKICADNALLEALRTPPPNPSEGLNNSANEDKDLLEDGVPQMQGSTPYRLMKTSSFDLRTCKASILKLRVGTLMRQPATHAGTRLPNQPQRNFPVETHQQVFTVSSFHSLASVVDFESPAQVQALGSLLSFLQSTTFRFDDCIFVGDIVRAQASTHMTVSADTLSALHIFAIEHHPLVAAKGSGNSKEGFSLFSLLDRTKSRAGRLLLREWMLKPLVDVDAIAARQDGVEMFSLPDMQAPVGSILSLLERIGAVDQILSRIQKCSAKHNDFLVLSKSLSSAVAIIDTLQEEVLWKRQARHDASTLGQEDTETAIALELDRGERYIEFTTNLVERCNVDSLQSLFERITSVIDEEASLECKSIVIRPGHHEQLDAYKQQFDRLEGECRRRADHEAFVYSNESQNLHICTAETLADVGAMLAESMPHLRDLMQVLFLPQVCRLIYIPPADTKI